MVDIGVQPIGANLETKGDEVELTVVIGTPLPFGDPQGNPIMIPYGPDSRPVQSRVWS